MTAQTKKRRNYSPTPNGALLIIGGAEDKGDSNQSKNVSSEIHPQVLETFFKLTPSRCPNLEIITTAGSENPEASFAEYKKAFEKIGACKVNQIHHNSREEVCLDDLSERLKVAHGIFFAGGDQLKITSIYGGTDFLFFIKERYIYEKLVVAGTSAGAMALSTPMIYAGVGRDEMIAGNVKVTTGLEFMRDVCIDTHFVDRGRFVRMAQVIATNPASIGVGIEENTALLVKNGVEASVVGCGVVIIIDAKNSFGTNVVDFNDKDLISIRGLQVDILSNGEQYLIPQMNPPHK